MTAEQKEKVVTLAKGLIGKLYKYGASLDEAPDFFDCSSLTQYLFKQVGIEIPRSSILQAADKNSREITPDETYSNLEIGDLLFMRGTQGYYNDELFEGRQLYIGHVGIYVGGGEIAHTQQKNGGVLIETIENLEKNQKYKIIYAKRI